MYLFSYESGFFLPAEICQGQLFVVVGFFLMCVTHRMFGTLSHSED